MLFNSFQFLLFFPIVTLLYFLLPHKFRWLHLLIASCVFYAAFIPIYLLILFFTIIVDYIAGIMIENAEGARRKWFLVLSIVVNVGTLAIFKYYNFFTNNINDLLHSMHVTTYNIPLLQLILPIGLSFHTFQAMSYTIEVYRGHQKAERHFGIYALYVMFYPQLVAGPIERPQNILHQFHEEKHFDYYNVTDGLKLMMWGMFKKVVIADRLALLTDPVFNFPHQYPPITLVLATLFFTFQIFCDFSGYSDIALGSAKVMGFTLMQNFRSPYQSKSISEFWKRWHISLSTWFRDYLYISLGGNRVSVPRWYFNLFFVFLVSGLWHGASWTFVIWGALHGFYLVFAVVSQPVRTWLNDKSGVSKLPWLNNTLQVLSTFVLAAFAWIFFRANNAGDAFYIIQKLPGAYHDLLHIVQTHSVYFMNIWELPNINYNYVWLCIGLILFMEIIHVVQNKMSITARLKKQPKYVRWAVYYAVVLCIIFMGVYENREFIYFQF
jgi:D-alanyl-lipoteichoic acid acyltransferase DltB (MBOAT superfamily)